jgi:putative flippase GtrA
MIRREAAIFLVVGATTVVIDFLVYRGILWAAVLPTDAAKAAGFLAGTVFAYFANRTWTFGAHRHRAGSWWRFALIYAATLGANVLVNLGTLNLLAGVPGRLHAAFLAATTCSALLNFIGMKLFVFAPSPSLDTV